MPKTAHQMSTIMQAEPGMDNISVLYQLLAIKETFSSLSVNIGYTVKCILFFPIFTFRLVCRHVTLTYNFICSILFYFVI